MERRPISYICTFSPLPLLPGGMEEITSQALREYSEKLPLLKIVLVLWLSEVSLQIQSNEYGWSFPFIPFSSFVPQIWIRLLDPSRALQPSMRWDGGSETTLRDLSALVPDPLGIIHGSWFMASVKWVYSWKQVLQGRTGITDKNGACWQATVCVRRQKAGD